MDKLSVAKAFGRAAQTYDSVAHLQRLVADRLLSHLIDHAPAGGNPVIADLGTGTGFCLPRLQSAFAPSRLIALDLSPEMLAIAKQRCASAEPIVGDLERPPFVPGSIDLSVSSLAVQWLDRPGQFLASMRSALADGGMLALTSLGPRTLYELRNAWAHVDVNRHVNDFHHAVDWLEAADKLGFELTLWREERLEVRYESPMQLLNELKALGANHVERSRANAGHLRKMLRAYKSFQRDDGVYPASWEVFYMLLRKPE